jgi:hypothetical protein
MVCSTFVTLLPAGCAAPIVNQRIRLEREYGKLEKVNTDAYAYDPHKGKVSHTQTSLIGLIWWVTFGARERWP